mgnify:CR=1 FL=1
MKIELSKTEIELINDALRVWQHEPRQGLGMCTVLTHTLLKDNKAEADRICKEETDKINTVVREREMKVILLMAKLIQAQTRNSEHDLSNTRQEI